MTCCLQLQCTRVSLEFKREEKIQGMGRVGETKQGWSEINGIIVDNTEIIL
jgi:hypothetical protein